MMQMQNAMVQMLNDFELIQNKTSSAAGDNRQQQQTEALIAQTLEEVESATRSVTRVSAAKFTCAKLPLMPFRLASF